MHGFLISITSVNLSSQLIIVSMLALTCKCCARTGELWFLKAYMHQCLHTYNIIVCIDKFALNYDIAFWTSVVMVFEVLAPAYP